MIILSHTLKLKSIFASLRAYVTFRGKNIRRGARVKLFGKVWLKQEGSLHVGPGCCFHAGPQATEITTQPGGSIEIGEGTMMNYGCILNASRTIKIGRRCRLGYGSVILDSHLHEIMPHQRHLRPEAKPVTLDDDVWIGTRAIVLAGVRIGYGSVVAAGSVVTRDVPPLTVVAGAPAQPIRTLDSSPSEARHLGMGIFQEVGSRFAQGSKQGSKQECKPGSKLTHLQLVPRNLAERP